MVVPICLSDRLHALLAAALLDRTIYLVHQMNAHLLVAWDEIDAERAMYVVESTHLLAVITSMTVRSLVVDVIVFALIYIAALHDARMAVALVVHEPE